MSEPQFEGIREVVLFCTFMLILGVVGIGWIIESTISTRLREIRDELKRRNGP